MMCLVSTLSANTLRNNTIELHSNTGLDDLNLTIHTSDMNPAIYTNAPFTYTLSNTGEEAIIDIEIQIGLCGTATGSYFNEFSFVQENKLVYSLPTPSTTIGDYNMLSQVWKIAELGAGEETVLAFNTFLLTDEKLVVFGACRAIEGVATNASFCSVDEGNVVQLALNDDCICTTDYEPVCGSDGVTYTNACEAECAGITDYLIGECLVDEACGFNKKYAPLEGGTGFSGRVFYDMVETDSTYTLSYRSRFFGIAGHLLTHLNLDKNGELLEAIDSIQSPPATMDIVTDNQLSLTRLDEEGNPIWTSLIDIDYPNPTQVSGSLVYQVSDGFVFGGIIVDASGDNVSFAGYIMKTDLEGNLMWQTLLPAIDDFYVMSNITEGAQRNLLIEWTASGDYSLARVDSSGVFHWLTQVASDTPSTTWNEVATSLDGAYAYAALTDNLSSTIHQIDMATGMPTIYNMGPIFNPDGGFTFNLGTGVLPLVGGDFIVSGAFRDMESSTTGFEYGRVTIAGERVWSHRLLSEEFNFDLAPVRVTSDGGLIFAGFHADSFAVIKTNAIGELDPLCGEDRLASFQKETNEIDSFLKEKQTSNNHINVLYPTITKQEINLMVKAESQGLEIRIYNLQGQEMQRHGYEHLGSMQHLKLDISRLPTGTYFVKLDGDSGQQTLRFLKM